MWWMVKHVFLFFLGLSFGQLAAAGVFTVFSTVTIVPRYVVRLQLEEKILLLENVILLGAMVGSLCQMWGTMPDVIRIIRNLRIQAPIFWNGMMGVVQAALGLFYGIFVGTLALSVAEMMDSLPIFSKRTGMKEQTPILIFFVALGKMAGAIFYFIFGF